MKGAIGIIHASGSAYTKCNLPVPYIFARTRSNGGIIAGRKCITSAHGASSSMDGHQYGVSVPYETCELHLRSCCNSGRDG